MLVRRFVLFVVTIFALLTGCKKAEVASYKIPKEKDPQMPVASKDTAASPAPSGAGGTAMANTPVATADGAALTWTAPAQWKSKAASSMRKGSYTIAGEGGTEADMSITAFPNNVGGELANVNRWRGQVALPPIGENDLGAAVVRHNHGGLIFGEVDLLGKDAAGKPARILGAWVAYGGATWFFKMMGPDAIVGKQKDAFAAFIDSVKPSSATP